MTKDNPVLLDKGIQELQTLLSELTILDNVYGRAHKRALRNDNTESTYPALYTGAGEYMSLLPNDALGNYCFVEIDDPQTSIAVSPSHMGLRVRASLVVWFNVATIYSDDTMLYTEEVKEILLRQLFKRGVMKHTSVEVLTVHEKPENVFRYNIRQIDDQYLLYPYHGFRIEFNLTVREECFGN